MRGDEGAQPFIDVDVRLSHGRLGQHVAVPGDGLGVAVGFDVPEVEGGHEVLERGVVSLLELAGPAQEAGQFFLEPAHLRGIGRLGEALPNIDLDALFGQKSANLCPFFVIFDDQESPVSAHKFFLYIFSNLGSS